MQIPDKSGWFSVQSEITINAPLQEVWSVLIDFDRYHEWNSFVPSMVSTKKVGELLTMQVKMREGMMTQSIEIITAIEPGRLLAWKTRNPVWFLHGERFQVLTRIDEHQTRYWTRESFKGILAPLLKIMYEKDLQRGFNAVGSDLKKRVEMR